MAADTSDRRTGRSDTGLSRVEAYDNNFVIPPSFGSVFALWFLSAGTGVTFDNTISPGSGSSLSVFFDFISERSNNNTYSQTTVPNSWGYCGTHFNGTGSSWDQNTNSVNGYQCLDNVGTGQGDLLTASGTASFPTIANTVLGGQTWPRQASEPVYEWGDSYTPGNWVDSAQYSSISPLPLQQNRDYYLWCNASATTGCTSFSGTVGVGTGTRAARPSTCTAGVSYFSTDQGNWNLSGSGGSGVLDKCTATNTWTNAWYVPGQFPNPLAGGTAVSLTVSAGGTGTGTISGSNCASNFYGSGTTIGPCAATPTGTSTFTGWTGTGNASACTGTGTCSPFNLTSTSTIRQRRNFAAGPTEQRPVITAGHGDLLRRPVDFHHLLHRCRAPLTTPSMDPTPTTGSGHILAALHLFSTTTVKAVCNAAGFSQSNVATSIITITTPSCGNPSQNGPPANPTYNFSNTFTCSGSTCTSSAGTSAYPLLIGFTSPTAGCSMFMTLDGSTPTCSSTTYSPQSLTVTTTMRYGAAGNVHFLSGVKGTWTIINPLW